MNVYLIKSSSLRLLHNEIKKITGDSSNIIRMNLDEININDVVEECLYDSLLNETKYVIINNFKINKENNIVENYFKNPNPNTVLILITDNIDKRSIIYKAVSKEGHIIIIDEIKELNNKINHYAKEKGIAIDYLAISKLLEYNLDNYDLVLNEIDKIALITNQITVNEIEKYSVKLISEDNFDFCDAIIKKNYKKISDYLDEFISLKLEISPFIALLAGQYRIIRAVKKLTISNDIIAKKLNIHPYRVKLAKENSVNYSIKEIQRKLLELGELDYNMKTTNIDRYILFKIFISKI